MIAALNDTPLFENNDTVAIFYRRQSMCNDECAKYWPPLKAESTDTGEGKWSTIIRDDQQVQWAYKGKPLYTFVKDKKAGDKVGDGKMDGAWKVAKP